MRRRTLLGSGAAVLTLGGFGAAASCIDSSGSASDFRVDVMASMANTIIMVGFADFVTQCAELRARSAAFCAAPDAAGLSAAQEQWMAARAQFKQLEVMAFGPYSAYPDRLGPKIDFWPARPDTIEEVLADDTPLTAEGMSGYGATSRGLPVSEYLLFAEKDGSLDAFVTDPRRCEYLTAVTGDLELLAIALHDAWDPLAGAFLLQLTEPESSGGMYMNIQESMSEIVNRMWFTVENIRRDKLGRPVGNESNGSPQPDKVESLYSQRSLDDIRDNLLMIELLFEGAPEGIGLIDHPRVQSYPDLVPSFQSSLQGSRDALDAINAPLDEAVLADGAPVQAAIDALADLQRAIQVDLIAALSLAIAFNDSDGD